MNGMNPALRTDARLTALDAADPRAYRDTMGMFATGVTVITMASGDEYHGMTANAVMSVSLTPPLVAVSIALDTFSNRFIRKARGFSLNILGKDDVGVALGFARPAARGKELFGEDVVLGPTGDPVLEGSIGHVGCSLRSVYEEGDHAIVVGHVEALLKDERSPRPLVFFGGRFSSTTCHACVVDGDLTEVLHSLHLV